jgi:hypothetical protein
MPATVLVNPSPAPTLLILDADDAAACVDEHCQPPERES